MARKCLCKAFLISVVLAQTMATLARAQDTDTPETENILTSSQNWSKNWQDSWREDLAARQSFWQEFFRWQVSENTLVRIYGQINVGHLNYRDGNADLNTTRDNPNSPSRLGVRLDMDFENGGNLFLNLESGFAQGTYDGVFRDGVGISGSDAWNKTLLRKAEGRIYHPNFGYFSLGQGSMAADGITGFDFSGTTVVSYSSVGDTISGIPARQMDGTESPFYMQSFFPVFDASRRLRLRYDSPVRNDMSVSFSVGREVLIEDDDNTYADFALRYDANWQGFGIKGGVGYSYNGSSPAFLSGSVAGLHDTTGFNFAMAAGGNNANGRYVYGKLGIIRQLIPAGSTAFSVDYYNSWDPQPAANASRSWGVSIVQEIDLRDMELYATYRDYAVDGTVVSYLDSQAVLIGARFSW